MKLCLICEVEEDSHWPLRTIVDTASVGHAFTLTPPISEVAVICPRECKSDEADHCSGPLIDGRARCYFCGRFIPLDEAISYTPD